VSGLGVALRYLTLVPVRGPHAGPEALGRAAAWFPVVGVLLGGFLAAVDALARLSLPPLAAALVVVGAWKLATGGLHLDGLADCADGIAGRSPEDRLAIMRDARIGAFGAAALTLVLMLDAAALSGIGPAASWRTLLVAPAAARAAPALLARLLQVARPGGLGAAFRAGLSRARAGAALAVALAIAVSGLGLLGVIVVCAAWLVALLVGATMAARLGGVTGDVHGAAIELAELAALLTVAAWTHLRP
jgi:adenosylcobinamide-GDP ribazoletransferase